MSQSWVPAPRYLLRKYAVLRLLRGLAPGRVLEVGCAQGDLLRTLAGMGYTGLGVDLSDDALREAREETLAGCADRMRAERAGAEVGTGPYDFVMSFEVLEHIEDDRGTLRAWRELLRPDGRLILSVPCGPHRWGPSDVYAGHFRRYTRAGLVGLLGETGFEVERLWCYGFPVANASQYLSNRIYARRQAQYESKDLATRSAQSGIDRSAIAPYSILWNNPLFRVFDWLQMLFVGTELGNGYLVRARAR